jgi:hypothetical protein
MLLSLEDLYEQTLRHVLTCRDCRARCAYLPRS